MSVQLLPLCVLPLFVPAADEFGYSVNIKLTLVQAEFLLVPHIETSEVFMCSTRIFLVEVLDIECAGLGGDGVDVLHSRLYNALF